MEIDEERYRFFESFTRANICTINAKPLQIRCESLSLVALRLVLEGWFEGTLTSLTVKPSKTTVVQDRTGDLMGDRPGAD